MTTSSEPRPYRIVRLLGTGGMAQVFEAVAEGAGGFRRRVALKRILPDHEADESVRRSFFDEARIVSHLHHGGIVAVLDYGIAEGVPFQVLEIVDGADARSLAESARKKGHPLTPGLALHICREVAHALHYAHEARGEDGHRLGLVHRDIKPANILLSWSGDVKLGDFGVAFASVRTEQTIDGAAKGTPPYMSPEQSRGDDVDARSDLYSLGCALHALLCGKSPLAAQSALVRVLRGEDAPLDPDLPDDVRDILTRALRTDRDARYNTAAEMAEALGRAAARRIDLDAKTELIAWIAAVRPDSGPVRTTGHLDALLGAELFIAGDSHEGTLRRAGAAPKSPLDPLFLPEPASDEMPVLRAEPTVRLPPSPTAGDSTAGDSPAGDSTAGDSAAGDSTPAKPTSAGGAARGRGVLAIALASSVALGLGVVSWVRFGRATPVVQAAATGHDTEADVPSGAGETTSSAGSVPVLSGSAVVADPSGTGTEVPWDIGGARPPMIRGSGHPSSALVPAAPAATTISASPSASAAVSQAAITAPATAGVPPAGLGMTGTLAVGGPVGATVLVDGAPRGLTPKYIPLSLGSHRVEVVSSDGARLGSTVVTLKPEHTPSAPLRWSPPKQ